MGGTRVGPTGDSGARGMRVTLFANNTGGTRLVPIHTPPPSGSLQVGGYKRDGNVDSDASVVAENPALCALVDIYNLMHLDGRIAEFEEKFPESPIANDTFRFFDRWG